MSFQSKTLYNEAPFTFAAADVAAAAEPDATAPKVASITRLSPTAGTTNADTLVFRVSFNESVKNVNAADFSVSGTTATVTKVTAGSNRSYDVTISGGDLAGLTGDVALAFAGDHDITDLAGNALTDLTPEGSNNFTYKVDNTVPRVSSIVRHSPTDETTGADTLVFRVTFDSPIKNVDVSDFDPSGTTATVTDVKAAGTNAYDVTVSGGDLAKIKGVVGLGFVGKNDIVDGAGNALDKTPVGANETYTIDNAGPATSIKTVKFSQDTGISDTDFITRKATQDISGTLSANLAAGEKVMVSVDGGSTWKQAEAEVGEKIWELDDATLTGSNILRVKLVNALGNSSPVFSQNYVLDTTAPAFASATVTGASMVISYNEAAKLDADHPPAATAFTVMAGGVAVRVHSVAIDATAKTVTLTLATPVAREQAVTVAYADRTPSDDVLGIQDVAGNDAVTMDATSVVNATPAPGAPAPGTSTVDGVAVKTGSIAHADGSTSATIAIPVIAPGRKDSAGDGNLADIPLSTVGNSNVLVAQLPTGLGLNVVSTGIKTAGNVLADLTREIKSLTPNSAADQKVLGDAASTFLKALPATTPLLVQAIAPTAAAGAAPTSPLTILGSTGGTNDPTTALVIDARGLPGGAQLQLQNVEFATIIGAANIGGGVGNQTVWGDSAAQTIVLGPGDDVLHGGGGNDTVGSGAGNDRIFGDDGNDTVFGGAGNDWIDGGAGRDTANLAGNISNYRLRVEDGQLRATDLVGSDGSDILAGVELLRFTGSTKSLDPVASIARLYDVVFGRGPDQPGAAFWEHAVDKGVSLNAVATELLTSPEGQQMAKLNNTQFVSLLYQRALEREATAEEAKYWITQLDSGKSQRGDVLLGFANSKERLDLDAKTAVTVDFNDSDIATIVRLYDVLFDRRPDQAGLNYWIGQRETGLSMHDIAEDFFNSTEAQAKYGNKSNSEFARLVLENAFERPANAAEVTRWAGLLDKAVVDHSTLLIGVAGSEELAELVGISTSIQTL